MNRCTVLATFLVATAISAGGDVTFVVATQVLRVIVMLLVAPVLARFAR